MANIGNFAFIGVENLIVRDKKTRDVLAEMPYLVNLTLSDSQPIEYLRGGFERLKLLPFKGDRETSLTVSTATSCPQLLELQMNTKFEEDTFLFSKIKNLSGTDGSFTLPESPAENATITVWAIDDVGHTTMLTKGASATAGTYTISGTTITCEASVKNIRVVYEVSNEAQVLKAKNVDTKVFEVNAMVVAQEVGTGAMYYVQIDIPSAVFQLNTEMAASNEGGVPDNVEFTIDMLADSTKDYVYKMSFVERL